MAVESNQRAAAARKATATPLPQAQRPRKPFLPHRRSWRFRRWPGGAGTVPWTCAQRCGLGFVVVQHLDPTHKGILVELLQRNTPMPVVQIKDRMKVEPDHVYVIPPNKDLSILHGVLHLLEPAAPRGLRLPIDFFFRSLADDQHEQSIGVILSGMGSDGTLGLRAIKEKAGAVFVQSPGLGQIRQHAPDGHRRRPGRCDRPGGGTARQDHRLPQARPAARPA